MRVFLSASADIDTRALRGTLHDLGAECLSTTDVASGGELGSVLQPTDRLIAVLQDSPVGNTAVLLELGIAIGRGLPVLIIAPSGSAIPAALANVIVVRGAADDPVALQLPLKLFLRTEAGQAPPSLPSSAGRDQVDLTTYRERFAQLQATGGSALEWQRLVADLLRHSGAQVEEQPGFGEEWRPDIALAIPDEEGRLGTVIVELKTSRNRETLTSAASQLVEYVLALRGGLGVLLYPGPELQLPTVPMTVSLSLDRLLMELGSRPLGEILVRARNEAIHRL